jgi:hypothetical protein
MSQVAELPMPNTYVQLMVRATRDVPRLLAGTGLTPGMLTEGRSITVAQQLACIRNSLAMMRRKDWHLAWGPHRVSAHFHGPISVAQLSAPTLGDGIDVFARYMHSRVPYMDWRGRQGARAYSLTITPRMPLGDLAPILFELPLLSLVSYVHSMRTGDIAGLTIELMHEPLVKAQDYRRWFDCEFRFGARRNAFVMPTALARDRERRSRPDVVADRLGAMPRRRRWRVHAPAGYRCAGHGGAARQLYRRRPTRPACIRLDGASPQSVAADPEPSTDRGRYFIPGDDRQRENDAGARDARRRTSSRGRSAGPRLREYQQFRSRLPALVRWYAESGPRASHSEQRDVAGGWSLTFNDVRPAAQTCTRHQ